MAKLYPPYIEGTIPAFTGSILKIPYSMNRAVSANEISGFSAKIKKVNVNEIVATIKGSSSNGVATFDIGENFTPVVGQFYKIQLAYIDIDGEVGYYSTVGIVKYTGTPTVSIVGLSNNYRNSHEYFYTGCYIPNEKDISERLYSSHFEILNTENIKEPIFKSKEILHNSINDGIDYSATEEFSYYKDIIDSTISYGIRFVATTINGLVISSPIYRLAQKDLSTQKVEANLIAKNNFDSGCIELYVQNEDKQKKLSGMFLLARASEDGEWEEVKRFQLSNILANGLLTKDYTVLQGVEYTYSLQQYSSQGIYTERKLSNPIYADFEDMFLFDGERQLKIRFNPKVSSFKTTILETKQDTIGGQYPFITRNGNVNYKEFPISGLISYLMDDQQDFRTSVSLGLTDDTDHRSSTPELNNIDRKVRTTQLVDYNFYSERQFKLDVLDWLNDGKVKLFRSPSEGNYLVRIMNVSLSPEDTINRLIHNFSANVVEVDSFNWKTMSDYGIIDVATQKGFVYQWETVLVNNAENECLPINKHSPVYYVKFEGFNPGTIIKLDDAIIAIGTTGSYEFNSSDPINVISASSSGSCTYSFYGEVFTELDTVNDVEIHDVPCRQFIGGPYGSAFLIRNTLPYEYEEVDEYPEPTGKIPYYRHTEKSGVHLDYKIDFDKKVVENLENYIKKYNQQLVEEEQKFSLDKSNLESEAMIKNEEVIQLGNVNHLSEEEFLVELKKALEQISMEYHAKLNECQNQYNNKIAEINRQIRELEEEMDRIKKEYIRYIYGPGCGIPAPYFNKEKIGIHITPAGSDGNGIYYNENYSESLNDQYWKYTGKTIKDDSNQDCYEFKRLLLKPSFTQNENIIDAISDSWRKLLGITSINLVRREKFPIYVHYNYDEDIKNKTFYRSSPIGNSKPIDWSEMDPLAVYEIRKELDPREEYENQQNTGYDFLGQQYYPDRLPDIFTPTTGKIYDPVYDEIYDKDSKLYSVFIDDEEVCNLEDTETFSIKQVEPKSLIIGRCVIAELQYREQIIHYDVEKESELEALLNDYYNAIENAVDLIEVYNKYYKFLDALNARLKEEGYLNELESNA